MCHLKQYSFLFKNKKGCKKPTTPEDCEEAISLKIVDEKQLTQVRWKDNIIQNRSGSINIVFD